MNIKTLGIFSGLILVGLIGIFFVLFSRGGDNGFEVDFGALGGIETSTYEIKKGDSPLFSDKDKRFSFNYPSEFSISQFGNPDEGETILAQKAGEKAGFQIFITKYDENAESLTAERIKSEIPEMEMNNVEPVNWYGKYIGVSFLSKNTSSETTREIWIVNNGLLYQMTTYMNEQKLLKQVLETWKFL